MTVSATTPGRALLSVVTLAGIVGFLPAEANPRLPPRATAASIPAAARTRDGCEVEERVGRCDLETVSAVDGATGVREVVAVYQVTEGAVPVRVQRRYRVSYLAAGEGPHMTFLRAHPSALCRWQTVVRGDCPAHPATVEGPEPSARESQRHGVHARVRTRHSRRAM